MVLRRAGPVTAKVPPGRGRAGMSLVELLVAMSLSAGVATMAYSLYLAVGGTALRFQRGREAGFTARIQAETLARSLMDCRGVAFLAPHEFGLYMDSGAVVEYHFQDSTLTVGGKPAEVILDSFEVDAWGRSRLDSLGHAVADSDAAVDSLDRDRDGQLSWSEMDADMSGRLEGRECRLIALVRVRFVARAGGSTFAHTVWIHPRRHWRPAAADTATSPWG